MLEQIYKPNSVCPELVSGSLPKKNKTPLSFILVRCYQNTLAAYPPTIERAALKRWFT